MKQHTSTSRDASNFSAAFYAVPHTARTQLLVSAPSPLLSCLLPHSSHWCAPLSLAACHSLLSAATTAHKQVAVSIEMGDHEVSCCHAGIGVLEASIARYFLYCLALFRDEFSRLRLSTLWFFFLTFAYKIRRSNVLIVFVLIF